MVINMHQSVSKVWRELLEDLLCLGTVVSPRGMKTYEILHNSLAFNMNYPVLLCDERKLSYKFLAGEALWILDGDESVAGIAPYNKNISQFSDDGETFYGAYGPRVINQLDYVVKSLIEDRDTRQAVLTLWHQNPKKSKDIPCTVAMSFNIRDGRLNCHVFMRSSDAWLGVPYDLFNFSMIAARVAWMHNMQFLGSNQSHHMVDLGTMYWTAASSHIYEQHFDAAQRCIDSDDFRMCNAIPHWMLRETNGWDVLKESLIICRDGKIPRRGHWHIRP